MAQRPLGRGKIVPARVVVTKTPAPEEPASSHSGRKGLSVLASLGIAGLLLVFTAQIAIAAIFGRTTNGTNTVTALTLVSPTSPAGVYSPSNVVLTWTAASPMNGQGYFIRAFNNGASGACPASIASYVTIVGSTAGVTLTDVGAIAQGAPGTFACYLIQTGYSSAGGPPWAAAPQWTSTTALAIASIRLGVVNVQIGPESPMGTGSATATLVASAAGNLLVAIIATSPNTVQSIAPAGWVYANGVNQPAEGRNEIWYYPNNPGGITTATFTFPAGIYGFAQLTEWKNVSRVTPLDRTGTVSVGAGSPTATVSTSAATSVANELAITSVGWSGLGTSYTPGAGWTSLLSDALKGLASEDRVNLAAAVASETVTSNAAETWSVVIATFK